MRINERLVTQMYTSTKMQNKKRNFHFCLLAIGFLTYVAFNFANGQDHGHAHDEPASHKYSKQANEQPPAAKVNHGHAHKHGDHGHAHSHGAGDHGHAHSHGGNDHGHAHSHGGNDHGHAHSHGGNDHGHAHSHGGNEHGQAHSHGGNDHGHAHSHGGNDHGHAHGKKDQAHGHTHGKAKQEPLKKIEPKQEPLKKSEPKVKNTGMKLWIEALTATAIISVSPVFILLFIPLDNTDQHQPLLKILLSFASGGLLGDAFLHLIPHAVAPHSHGGEDHGHSHDHDHSHGEGGHAHDMSVGLWVLAGIITFLIVEKFVRIVKGGHSHSHSHSHAPPAVADKKDEKKGKEDSKKSDDDKESSDKKTETDKKTDETKHVEVVEDIKVAGYLNLAADFAHNFTDGLAIGASFMMGQSIGIITTITIFLHEIPHEIGGFCHIGAVWLYKEKGNDAAIQHCHRRDAGNRLQPVGRGVGSEATLWILPFTAGGFIYIATVSVIPELLEDTKLGQSIKEICALLVGVYMMVLIGQYE